MVGVVRLAPPSTVTGRISIAIAVKAVISEHTIAAVSVAGVDCRSYGAIIGAHQNKRD
jgi:hypothetical protein